MPRKPDLYSETWGYWIDSRMPSDDIARILGELGVDAAAFVEHFRGAVANARGWRDMSRTHYPPAEEARILKRLQTIGLELSEALRHIPTRSHSIMAGIAYRDGNHLSGTIERLQGDLEGVLRVAATVRAQVESVAHRGRPTTTTYRDMLAVYMVEWIKSQRRDDSEAPILTAVAEILAACGLALGEDPRRAVARGRRRINQRRGGN